MYKINWFYDSMQKKGKRNMFSRVHWKDIAWNQTTHTIEGIGEGDSEQKKTGIVNSYTNKTWMPLPKGKQNKIQIDSRSVYGVNQAWSDTRNNSPIRLPNNILYCCINKCYHRRIYGVDLSLSWFVSIEC